MMIEETESNFVRSIPMENFYRAEKHGADTGSAAQAIPMQVSQQACNTCYVISRKENNETQIEFKIGAKMLSNRACRSSLSATPLAAAAVGAEICGAGAGAGAGLKSEAIESKRASRSSESLVADMLSP